MPLSNCKILNYNQANLLSGASPGTGGMRQAVWLKISPKESEVGFYEQSTQTVYTENIPLNSSTWSYRIGLKSSDNVFGNLTYRHWPGTMLSAANPGQPLGLTSADVAITPGLTPAVGMLIPISESGLNDTEFGPGGINEFLLPTSSYKVWRKGDTFSLPGFPTNPPSPGLDSNFLGNPNPTSSDSYILDWTWDNMASLNEDVYPNGGFPNYVNRILAFDTMGYDADGDPMEGNEVIIIIVFEDSFILNPGDNIIDLDFDLAAKIKLSSQVNEEIAQGGMMPFISGNTQQSDLEIKVKNGAKLPASHLSDYGSETITITNKNNHNSIKSINEKGIVNEENCTFRIYGETIKNKTTTVAEIKITACATHHFVNAPRLVTDYEENIVVRVKKKERTNKKITSYILTVAYKNSTSRVPRIGSAIINGTILYETKLNQTKSIKAPADLRIKAINCGKENISISGETRPISITGDSGASFAIAINERFADIEQYYEHETTSVTNTGRVIANRHNDVSILGYKSNATTTYNYGKEMKILKGKIPTSGRYRLSQDFPSSKAVTLKVTSAVSAANRLLCSGGTTGVRKGDRLRAPSINSDTIVKVNTVASGHIDVDKNVTIPINTDVAFSRDRVYGVDIIPDLSSPFLCQPTQLLRQDEGVSLTVRASTATTDFTINGGSAGAEYDLVYASSKLAGTFRNVDVKLTVVKASGNWSSVGTIYFSKTNQSRSSWTNSVPEENGFTDVTIGEVSYSGVGTDTVIINYKLSIRSIGRKNITMDLDLDKILT
tara:strand:- start:2334 stop:4670 length:2337 start_codon:yes stop_codon:yes gene_type:complete